MRQVMGRAGVGVPSVDRNTLLRDIGGVGVSNQRSVPLDGLHLSFGMALVGGGERERRGGRDLAPSYLTRVQDGGFYSWPHSCFGQHGAWNRRHHSG